MEQQKQPNWLKVAVVTTIVGGVVQVIVNHFDNIVAFLGGAISYVHLPVSIALILNIVSALATVGGAIATVLAYRYARDAKKLRSTMIRIHKILTEASELQNPLSSVPEIPVFNRDDLFEQLEREGAANLAQIPQQSEQPKPDAI